MEVQDALNNHAVIRADDMTGGAEVAPDTDCGALKVSLTLSQSSPEILSTMKCGIGKLQPSSTRPSTRCTHLGQRRRTMS